MIFSYPISVPILFYSFLRPYYLLTRRPPQDEQVLFNSYCNRFFGARRNITDYRHAVSRLHWIYARV